MSLSVRDQSIESGQPIHLYEFALDSIVWRYAAASEDVERDGHKWRAVSISHDGINQTGDASADALTISASSTIGPVTAHMGTPPAQAIQVRIRETHHGETDSAVVYVGEIAQVDFGAPGEARIVCETLSASMRRDGLRLPWQRTCPYALYDPLTCRIDKASWAVQMVVLSVEGRQITVSTVDGKADSWFDGGFLEWNDPVRGKEFKTIESQVGTTMVIFGMPDGLHAGLEVTAYPGCTRDVAGCNKFGNRVNYGGFDAMPGRSPFDGNPIFYT